MFTVDKRAENQGRLSPLMALRLAAPHTWAASVIPALLGAALAAASGVNIHNGMLLCLTAVCVFMQSAVNTFNDYSDYIKGTDSLENSPDPSDAVLVYDKPAPRRVLMLGFAYLLLAAAAGFPAVLHAGWRPLAIGAAGAFAVLFYSFGKKPLSYLPLGELCSGFVMGGLIPLAVYGVLTGSFDLRVLLFSLPVMLGVALIMFTNNACDIRRDMAAGRRTFPVLLGRKRLKKIYKMALALWLLLPVPFLLSGPGTPLVYLLALLPASGLFALQFRLPLGPECRGQAMSGIVSLNVMLGLGYIAALLFK